MQRHTRILICRLGIVLFCLLPTTVVGGWIASRSHSRFSEAHKAAWQRSLATELGLGVAIGEISFPGPAATRLGDVEFFDPETRWPLARARGLVVEQRGGRYSIAFEQLIVEARHLDIVARQLDSRVLRSPRTTLDEAGPLSVELLPSDVLIHHAGQYLSLLKLQLALEATAEETRLTSQFHLPGAAEDSAPLRCELLRTRATVPAATTWRLDTAASNVPCTLVTALVPEVAALGPSATFAGRLEIRDAGAGWSAELAGSFSHIDLDSLVSERFPHQLSGLASAQVESARVESGRLVELRGTLHAQNGAVSGSLLQAARDHLALEISGGETALPGDLATFRQLAVEFALDERRLALAGLADPTEPGVMLASAGGPLARSPAGHAVPAVHLLRALLPAAEHQVPATRQTSGLASILPLPDAAPALMADRPARHIPARLVPSPPGTKATIRQPKLR